MIRRSTSTLTLVALLGAFTPGLGCLVSFDGYEPLGDTSDGGESGSSRGGNGAGKGGGGAAAGKGGGGGKAGSSENRGGSAGSAPSAGGNANAGGTTTLIGGRAGRGGDGNESGEAGAAATGGGDTGGTEAGGKGGAGGSANDTGGSSGTAGSVNAGAGGSSGTGGSAGVGGAGGSSGAESCPLGLPGPALIEVPAPDGGFFCIDRTEVTNAQYAAFLDDAPSASEQDAVCDWNPNFGPEVSNECDPMPYDPDARPNNPMTCVDWCDARAFCQWAGKELCGAIDGGENPSSDFDDPVKSAWYRGCSAGGTKALPYGDGYDGTACVGLDYGVVRAVNVASVAQCQGGYDGLWDMSGNVSEWEDSCDGSSGPSGRCVHRGGSWLTPGEAQLYCNSSLPSDTTPNPVLTRRDSHDEHIGFRCCYRP